MTLPRRNRHATAVDVAIGAEVSGIERRRGSASSQVATLTFVSAAASPEQVCASSR
jgi:hypothetical protein